MNNKFTPAKLIDVTDFFNIMTEKISKDLSEISPQNYINLRFEDFESNNLDGMKKIYSHFNIDFPLEFEQKLNSYLATITNYQKNTFYLNEEDKKIIRDKLANYMELYGYNVN
jgi:omega-hydroxy-beta-dihydromenaquinone-9 sulfotransferase